MGDRLDDGDERVGGRENSICKGVAGERAQGEGLAGAHDLWVLLPTLKDPRSKTPFTRSNREAGYTA